MAECASCGGPLYQKPASPIEAEYEAAQAAYSVVADRLIAAIPPYVAQRVRAIYPDATTLRANGEMGEDGPILRAQFVSGASGLAIAGWDSEAQDDIDDSGKWKELTDAIDPLLDWLIELTGDDYFGDQDFDIA